MCCVRTTRSTSFQPALVDRGSRPRRYLVWMELGSKMGPDWAAQPHGRTPELAKSRSRGAARQSHSQRIKPSPSNYNVVTWFWVRVWR
eukprot:2535626-Rhodomonas_salina.1